MQKDIEHGARTTGRFALDGTECKVVFSSPFRCFEVKNEGTSDIIVSLDSGKTAADNGVVVIAAQTSATLAHMRSDVNTVYVTGTGNVQIVGKNEVEAVFKSAGTGGGVDSGLNDEMIAYVDNAVATARTNPYADYELLGAKAHTAGQTSIFVGYTKPASFVITPSEYAVVITDKRDIPLYSGNITIGDSSTMTIAWDNDNAPSDISLIGSAAGQVTAFGMLLKVKDCTAVLIAKTAPSTEMVVTGVQTMLTSADVFDCMNAFMKYNVYIKRTS